MYIIKYTVPNYFQFNSIQYLYYVNVYVLYKRHKKLYPMKYNILYIYT